MIKDIFKNDTFTFSEWINLYKKEDFLIRVFGFDYMWKSNINKRNLLLKDFTI